LRWGCKLGENGGFVKGAAEIVEKTEEKAEQIFGEVMAEKRHQEKKKIREIFIYIRS
jgi:hypothetical protein